MRKILILTLLSVVALASGALALDKGSSMLALEIGHGQADQVNDSPGGGGYLGLNTDAATHNSGEMLLGVEFWHMITSDYAMTVSGALGTYREVETPAGGGSDLTYTTSSYRVRLGGDRVGQIGSRFTWFMGPGVELWSGRSKYEGPINVESPRVTRWALNGRVGGVMALSGSLGVVGRLGDSFGYASAKTGGAKTWWLASGFDAMWGLTYSFGGKR